jgi:hypothetical protein
MNPKIKWSIYAALLVLFVEVNWICADLSMSYREFLKVFCWELPVELVKAWIPGLS